MINENSYFEGNVKSLGYSSSEGKSTVGVMEEGEYEFGTGSPEKMTVIEGELQVQLIGETTFNSYKSGTFFNVPGNSKFKVRSVGQTSYLCQFL